MVSETIHKLNALSFLYDCNNKHNSRLKCNVLYTILMLTQWDVFPEMRAEQLAVNQGAQEYGTTALPVIVQNPTGTPLQLRYR